MVVTAAISKAELSSSTSAVFVLFMGFLRLEMHTKRSSLLLVGDQYDVSSTRGLFRTENLGRENVHL